MIGPKIIDAMDRVGVGSARVRSAWDAALPQTVYQFSQVGNYSQLGFTDLQSCYEAMLSAALLPLPGVGHWRISALTPRLGLLRPTAVGGKRKWFVAEAWATMHDIQGSWSCRIITGRNGAMKMQIRHINWDREAPPGLQEDEYVDD
jgi:hypothetical protein